MLQKVNGQKGRILELFNELEKQLGAFQSLQRDLESSTPEYRKDKGWFWNENLAVRI